MLLRDVELRDVDAYLRMRCDPAMTVHLGGPEPREGIQAKVERDAERAAADIDWIKMIVPDQARPERVAGSVVLWSRDLDGEPISETGWMVLPEFQRQGLGRTAVRRLLALAADDGRWGLVHAFPATTNAASNALCRSLGFRLAGEQDVMHAGHLLRTNQWIIEPRSDLTTDAAP